MTGHGRKRGGADHTPHQRYPSSSDESHSRGGGGAEPEEQATPKSPSKVNGAATSQDSGFDCMPQTGKIIKVELEKNPSLGLGIREGGTEQDSNIKPGYHVYKIVEGSPAAQCGMIKLGDRIMEINGVEVSSLDLPDILCLLEVDPSQKITLTLHRDLSMTLL
jgi:S1-C subfamily serine protease